MKIKINGQEEVLEQKQLTIKELLSVKDVKMPDMVSVEYNGDILDRENYGSTQVKEGDEIEFLYFMGGGQKTSRMCCC